MLRGGLVRCCRASVAGVVSSSKPTTSSNSNSSVSSSSSSSSNSNNSSSMRSMMTNGNGSVIGNNPPPPSTPQPTQQYTSSYNDSSSYNKSTTTTTTTPRARTATSVVGVTGSKLARTTTLRHYYDVALEAARHIYHGFRLFFINTRLAWKYSRQLKRGVALTRRERLLLESSTKDLLRLVPFSFFIVVPFAELLLPVVLKMFPGVIPSTFETESQGRNRAFADALKTLRARQRVVEYMSVTALATFDDAQQAVVRRAVMGESITPKDIRLVAPYFNPNGPFSVFKIADAVAVSLGRVLGVYRWYYRFFPSALIAPVVRRQIVRRWHDMREDDRLLRVEGLDSLDEKELIKANQARGMRWTENAESLRVQLEWWIALSRDPAVPYNTLFWLKPTRYSLRKSMNNLPVEQRRQLLGIQNLPESVRSSLEVLCDTVPVASTMDSDVNTADKIVEKIADIKDSAKQSDTDIALQGVQLAVGAFLVEDNVRQMFAKLRVNKLETEAVVLSDVIEYIGHATHTSSHVVSILFDAFDYSAGSMPITEAALMAIGARCRDVDTSTTAAASSSSYTGAGGSDSGSSSSVGKSTTAS